MKGGIEMPSYKKSSSKSNYKTKTPIKKSSQITIKDVKKGEYIKIGKTVYRKGEYDRSAKKFEAIKLNDIWGNPRLVKGSTPVDVDFEY